MGGVVFLSFYLFGKGCQHYSLLVIELSRVLALSWRSLGELSPFDITWSWEVSCGPLSWTWLSHLRGTGLTPGWSTKTVSATWLRRKGRKKRKKERKKRKEKKVIKVNNEKILKSNKKRDRKNSRTNGKSKAIQAKSYKEAYTYTLKKREKRKKYIYI